MCVHRKKIYVLSDLRKNLVFEFCNLIFLYANHNVDNIQRLSISKQNYTVDTCDLLLSRIICNVYGFL